MALFVFMITMSAMVFAAHDRATPKEIVQKVNEAVVLVQEKGEGAYDILRDKNGPFIWKDAYVFVQDVDGNMLMHPFNRKLDGRNMMGVKDAKGKLFTAEQVAIVKGPSGEGWIEYWWIKPNEKKPSQKVSYIKLVPGTKYWVGAGIFDMSKEEAENASK